MAERRPRLPRAIPASDAGSRQRGWDRGAKFRHLCQIPTLQAYVLVSQDPALVEVYTRGAAESWELRRYGPGQQVPLVAIGAALDVDALYRNPPAEPPG